MQRPESAQLEHEARGMATLCCNAGKERIIPSLHAEPPALAPRGIVAPPALQSNVSALRHQAGLPMDNEVSRRAFSGSAVAATAGTMITGSAADIPSQGPEDPERLA